MRMHYRKKYLSLITWIVALVAIGSIIGSLTIAAISTWYSTLNRSPLTPPNYVFPVVWSILYSAIGACGWLIWRTTTFSVLSTIKTLYMIQLILNWSWTPLFFYFHLIKTSLFILISMDIIVGMLILLAYSKIKTVSLLMIPYLLWILIATYLNLYIWQYN
jgi:benzodiazapine receptor